MGCVSSKENGVHESNIQLLTENKNKVLLEQTVFNEKSTGLSVLLVFPRPDHQTTYIIEAIEKLNCYCSLLLINYSAVWINDKSEAVQNPITWCDQVKLNRPIDLLLIDRRFVSFSSVARNNPLKTLQQAADLVRDALRNRSEISQAVVAALISHKSSEKRASILKSVLNAGYNKCLLEFPDAQAAEQELFSFLHNELMLIRRYRKMASQMDDKQSFPHNQTTKDLASRKILDGETTSKSAVEFHEGGMETPLEKLHVTLPDYVPNSLETIATEEGQPIFRRVREQSHSIPNATFWFPNQVKIIPKSDKNRGSFELSSNLDTTTSLYKAISILNSMKKRVSTPTGKELQEAIDIIYKSDVLVNHVFLSVNQKKDPLGVDLMEGLMVSRDADRRKRYFPRSVSAGSGLRTSVVQNSLSGGLTPEIETFLENDDQWNYDVLALEKVTQKRPLRYLAMKAFHRFNVFDILRVDEKMMIAWLTVIEENYHSNNPYHNATHAADVMQSTAYLIRREILTPVFDSIEEVAMLLAAVIHDLDHPGRTNPFLVNSNNTLAILYNDLAVLESHHVALAFDITRKNPNINIFKNLSREEYRTIRGYMIDLVLATEMARHFDYVSKFINNISTPIMQNNALSTSHSGSSIATADTTNDNSTCSNENDDLASFDILSNAENRAILRRMIIKCSDVNNPTRPLALCKEWANRIAEEYFCQTEEEKQLGLPIVMPNFDRQTCNIPKSQISFIDLFIKNMFSAFDSVCAVPELMENLEKNYKYWEALRDNEPLSDDPNETLVKNK